MKYLLTILFTVALLSTNHAQAFFSYDDFKDSEKIKTLGSAISLGTSMRLTGAKKWKRGAVWYLPKVNIKGGFDVNFQFLLTEHGGYTDRGADGFAFVIQNDPYEKGIGQNGQGLGYTGLSNCIVVEFDTFDNGEGSDNHVSIQSNGKGKVSSAPEHTLVINHKIKELRNQIHTVHIEYTGSVLKVWMDNDLVLKKRMKIEKIMELDEGRAWIGFTAGTADAYSKQEIFKWRLNDLKPRA